MRFGTSPNEDDSHIWQFTEDVVKERTVTSTDQKDMLNTFLDVHWRDPQRVSLREVHAAAYINM